MKRILIFLSIIGCFVSAGHAEDGVGAAAHLNVPITARAAAMGGAAVSVSQDASAVFWNPALLGPQEKIGVTSSLLNVGVGDDKSLKDTHLLVAAVFPMAKFGVLGIGVKRFSSDNIEEYNESGDYLGSNFANAQQAFYLSYGRTLVEGELGVGLVFKYLLNEFSGLQAVENAAARGFGFAFGLYYNVFPNVRLALRADDNIKMKWENKSEHIDEALYKGVAGVAFSLLNDMTLLAFDFEQVKHHPLKLHSGLEFNYKPSFLKSSSNVGLSWFALRAGLDDLHLDHGKQGNSQYVQGVTPVFGFGLGLQIDTFFLHIDYSYSSTHLGQDNIFTVSFCF